MTSCWLSISSPCSSRTTASRARGRGGTLRAPAGRQQGGPVWSRPGLRATPSGVKQPGVQDHCGLFFLCPVFGPCSQHTSITLPGPSQSCPPFLCRGCLCPKEEPQWRGCPCFWSPHPKLRLTLLTSLQPEEFQQQAGPADSGADLGASGQSASQLDQHQAELYASPPSPACVALP